MPYKDPKKHAEYHRAKAKAAKHHKKLAATETAGPLPGANPAPEPPPPCKLRTAADVLPLLEEQVNAVRADVASNTQTRARTVGYLVQIFVSALQVVDLAERVAALEGRAGR